MFLLTDGLSRISQALRLRDLASGLANGLTALLGVVFPPEFVARVTASVQLPELAYATVTILAWLAVFLCFMLVIETLFAPKRSPYTSRTFVQDVLYALFYQGGFYNALLWTGLVNVLNSRMSFLKIEVLSQLPPIGHLLIYWVIVDFLTYWWHRSLHTWGPLWAFHSVHHTQEEMSFITAYRMHPVEQLCQNLIMVVPLLVLGVPTQRWLSVFVVMNLLEGFQHTALTWGYGRAYYVFVSPRFHAVHHSADPSHFNSNYAKLLSIWDFLFGTAIRADRMPERLGVDGLPVPRTIGAQLLAPFVILFGRRSPADPSTVAAAPMPTPRSASGGAR
ncbi:MAG: sterol desaturase family protein [Gemmatimonadota bacterium]|nr:sterol desaturase family protein [Gemmatimonadota bacterium]